MSENMAMEAWQDIHTKHKDARCISRGSLENIDNVLTRWFVARSSGVGMALGCREWSKLSNRELSAYVSGVERALSKFSD